MINSGLCEIYTGSGVRASAWAYGGRLLMDLVIQRKVPVTRTWHLEILEQPTDRRGLAVGDACAIYHRKLELPPSDGDDPVRLGCWLPGWIRPDDLRRYYVRVQPAPSIGKGHPRL